MKRLLALALLLVLVLCGCGSAAVRIGPSELYAREELQAAADTVLNVFEQGYNNSRLVRLEYDEALTLQEAEYRGEEPVIVLVTDFYVKRGALAVGPMYPGRPCTDYKWILTRGADGQWTIRDKGYG